MQMSFVNVPFFSASRNLLDENIKLLPAATLSQSRETGGTATSVGKSALCGYEI